MRHMKQCPVPPRPDNASEKAGATLHTSLQGCSGYSSGLNNKNWALRSIILIDRDYTRMMVLMTQASALI